jgi:hypothetical protein
LYVPALQGAAPKTMMSPAGGLGELEFEGDAASLVGNDQRPDRVGDVLSTRGRVGQQAKPEAGAGGRTPKAAAAEKEQWGIVELLTPRVGDFYDVQRFMFEGAKTFTPQTLREALRNTRDFFEVSHPLAPQEAYLETIQRKLLLGVAALLASRPKAGETPGPSDTDR